MTVWAIFTDHTDGEGRSDSELQAIVSTEDRATKFIDRALLENKDEWINRYYSYGMAMVEMEVDAIEFYKGKIKIQ